MDWGQDSNYTALSIVNRTTRKEVFVGRWRRMPYSVIRQRIVRACKHWNVIRVTPEKNSMSSNVESLRDDFRAAEHQTSVVPFVMTNPDKHQLVTDFKEGYQTAGATWLKVSYATQELNTFVKKQNASLTWTYDTISDDTSDENEGAHGDTVIARLLAWPGS